MNLDDYLTPEEQDRFKRTLEHFLSHPDYATGDEQGLTFEKVTFGQPLPLEVVVRDWRTALNNGTGGRVYRQGDCYAIYEKLYESGLIGPESNP